MKLVKAYQNGVEYLFDEYWEWKPGANTIAYYPLTSTTTVNDMSGNNNNGTNQGVVFSSTSGVDCGQFNGTTSYIDLPLIANNLSGWTINVWIKSNSGKGTIFTRQKDGVGSSTILLGYYQQNTGWSANGTDYCIYGKTINSGGSAVGSSAMSSSSRSNIVITGTGSEMRIYINGVLSISGNGNYAFDDRGTSYTYCRLGYWSGAGHEGPKYLYNGYMSKFIIENKVRTAQEITDYYQNSKSNYGL